MVQQTSEMVHKEKRTLWTVKHLLTKFRGDSGCIPGDHLLSTDDAFLFPIETIQGEFASSSAPAILSGHEAAKEKAPQDENNNVVISTHRSDSAAGQPPPSEENTSAARTSPRGSRHNRSPQPVTESQVAPKKKRVSSPQKSPRPIADIEGEADAVPYERPINDSTHNRNLDQQLTTRGSTQELKEVNVSGGTSIEKGPRENRSAQATPIYSKEESEPLASSYLVHGIEPKENVQAPTRRMRTRAQAQAVTDQTISSHIRSLSPDALDASCVHPLYQMPPSTIPDRDYGLPSLEAEETRRMLVLWVQKQEEVVRAVERLYGDLLKADRMRKTVIKWCRAEGHVGEMSDGEDWYDKEEWGVEEDLKKGQLEEEDESTNQGKKTRGRRVAQ